MESFQLTLYLLHFYSHFLPLFREFFIFVISCISFILKFVVFVFVVFIFVMFIFTDYKHTVTNIIVSFMFVFSYHDIH